MQTCLTIVRSPVIDSVPAVDQAGLPDHQNIRRCDLA